MEFLVSICDIVKNLGEVTGKWFGYINSLNANSKIFKRKIEALSSQEDDIKTELSSAEQRSGKRRKKVVHDWLGDVPMLKGILEPSISNGCKLVLTTRSLEVCRKMECRAIKVELLMSKVEEHQIVLTPKVKEIVTKVAKECARLPFAITTIAGSMGGNFPNLEQLKVSSCKHVEDIIVEVEMSDQGHHQEDSNTITLQNFKRLQLLSLPRLKSIYKSIMVCESLQDIVVDKCHTLRRLPLSLHMDNGQASAPPALQHIWGDNEWWKSLD
ncbi:Disease resistance protein SUMM2 [Camellia lanceoleosa]|uniref:Disease resistance protein SUMM2 n=1 Tax=Camellia lanceoleosa TaxID=1840588 RepID=A0ACC0INJ7_9ERIC|nr:Disease resistance protein SUMM2 [Camellia lanceoleosa]